MTTKEFIKRVHELGYETKDYIEHIEVKIQESTVGSIYKESAYELDTNYEAIYDNEELFELMVEYAKTPIIERENHKHDN